MGLFKRKPSAADGALTEAEAVAAVAVTAVYADGVISADEDDHLARHLATMKLFRGMGDGDVRAMMRKLIDLSTAEGDDGLLARAATAIPARLKPTAFLLAADLVLSDDEFGADEKRYLKDLQGTLGLDDATATRILDVLAIKQMG